MRQGLCITLEPHVQYSCVFVDVDKDELEHLLVLMKLCTCQAALPSLTDGRMETAFLHNYRVVYLQRLSPLYSLGFTPGFHPRSTPAESGLSLFSVYIPLETPRKYEPYSIFWQMRAWRPQEGRQSVPGHGACNGQSQDEKSSSQRPPTLPPHPRELVVLLQAWVEIQLQSTWEEMGDVIVTRKRPQLRRHLGLFLTNSLTLGKTFTFLEHQFLPV